MPRGETRRSGSKARGSGASGVGWAGARLPGRIQVDETLGQSHFDALRFEVDAAEVTLGEGNEDFASRASDDKKGRGACGAVNILNCADGDGVAAGDVNQRAAGEVADVGLVFGECGSSCARNGDDEAFERFSR